MFGLKSVYFYLLAVQITLIKILKKFYFSSKNYNKSLESITPQQVYFSPNPFLLSIITSYKNRSFKINEVDPNVFWLEDKKKNSDQAHKFLWLNLIDRKGGQKNLKKIIYIWMLKNSKYQKKIWETSTLSVRIISWILNIDIILNKSTFEFKKNFLNSIVAQSNHLKKNIKFEKNFLKKTEILTAIILSGLVFKEYDANFQIGVKELETLVKNVFDNDGFPLSRNPSDLLFYSKYLILCREVIKDSQKYVPEFLEDIIEKNLICLNYIKTPNDQLPLFNGATISELSQIIQYLEKAKTKNINKENFGGLFKIKHKSHLIFIDVEKPPQKKFSNSYQSGPLSFEYFLDDIKIISNSGFGSSISEKAEKLSRLTACQSTLTLNDTSITKFEQNEFVKKVFGNSIKNSFKSFDLTTKNENQLLGCSATNNGYEKSFGCTHRREIYIDKENNYLKGIDHIFKKKDGYPVRYSFRFHVNPELTVVKTMSGNGALIQISKNKSLLFTINDENLELEKSIFFAEKKILDSTCITITGNLVNKNKSFNWEIKKNI
ncbi:heparinase II/III family protein [Candidatus Pelagibacter bacterium]|nr:heparinase II/III family protein [Candidatus Pelagibacter bacterium]